MYLLDTDILVNLMGRCPSTALIAKLASVPPEQQSTSSITLEELIVGVSRFGRASDCLTEPDRNTAHPQPANPALRCRGGEALRRNEGFVGAEGKAGE